MYIVIQAALKNIENSFTEFSRTQAHSFLRRRHWCIECGL
jgi:hypothetical protein